MRILETGSADETERFGVDFAKTLPPVCVVALHGELGAGKTVFVKGLAKGLGIDSPVVSPTFTIVNEYEGAPPLYHFDLYRLSRAEELLDIGFEEYASGGVCVIEWPEIAAPYLPRDTINVFISADAQKCGDYRKITINED